MRSEHPAVAHIRNAHRISGEHARKATPGPWETEGDDPTDDQVMTVHDGEHGDWVGGTVAFVRSGAWGRQPAEGRTQANMCLIADHAAPDVVLRRIEAEQELLAEHESYQEIDGPLRCNRCASSDAYSNGVAVQEAWPCRTVRLIARGWGWTEKEDSR